MKLIFELDTANLADVKGAYDLLAKMLDNNSGTKAATAEQIAEVKDMKAKADDADKRAAAKVKADAAKVKADTAAKVKADAAAKVKADAAAIEASKDECPFDDDEAPTYTLAEVRGKLKAYAALEDKAAAIKVLREIGGATSVSELAAENYAKVVEACEGV